MIWLECHGDNDDCTRATQKNIIIKLASEVQPFNVFILGSNVDFYFWGRKQVDAIT